jgi:hypothetical protein
MAGLPAALQNRAGQPGMIQRAKDAVVGAATKVAEKTGFKTSRSAAEMAGDAEGYASEGYAEHKVGSTRLHHIINFLTSKANRTHGTESDVLRLGCRQACPMCRQRRGPQAGQS